jgi:hypothetical protein
VSSRLSPKRATKRLSGGAPTEGADKLATLDRALGPGPAEATPIRAAPRSAAEGLTIFAAPR